MPSGLRAEGQHRDRGFRSRCWTFRASSPPLLPDCIREATREALKRACEAAVAADEEEWMSTEVTTTDSIRTRRPTDPTDAVQHRMDNGGPARCNRCRLAFEESLAWMAANGGNVEPV